MRPDTSHIAIIAPPLPGHLNPLQVVGVALVGMGHRVTMVHVGDARRFVTTDAIGFVALPEGGAGTPSLDAYLEDLAHATGPTGLTRMIRATAAMADALLAGAPAILERIGATAVIADAAEPAGSLIARRTGLPYVVSVTGLPLMREDNIPPPYVGWRYRPDAIGRWRNLGGYMVSDWLMRPITRALTHRRRMWRLDGQGKGPRLHVAQCPRGLDYPRADPPPGFLYGSPWRPATRNLVLENDGRPLVFCSLGTLQGARRSLFAIMAEACAAIGARAVIGHGGGLSRAEEASLPGRPLVRAFWPQEAVLRQCTAAVLHGGFNTVLDALAAGVPIVALPIAFEQPAIAARLLRIGAARVLSPRRLDVPALVAALKDVVRQPVYRDAARRMAAEMTMAGGAAAAAEAISAALA